MGASQGGTSPRLEQLLCQHRKPFLKASHTRSVLGPSAQCGKGRAKECSGLCLLYRLWVSQRLHRAQGEAL